jgi:hypothetical protein
MKQELTDNERAAVILGVEKNTLEHQKSLAERFELCTRVQSLSWGHHREVASIKKIEVNGKVKLSDEPDHEVMTKLLKQAEKEKLSTRQLADIVSQYKRRQQEEIRLANEPERYSLITGDRLGLSLD